MTPHEINLVLLGNARKLRSLWVLLAQQVYPLLRSWGYKGNVRKLIGPEPKDF